MAVGMAVSMAVNKFAHTDLLMVIDNHQVVDIVIKIQVNCTFVLAFTNRTSKAVHMHQPSLLLLI